MIRNIFLLLLLSVSIYGQDYLLPKQSDVNNYIKMQIYNELFYDINKSISLERYSCIIKNADRVLVYDTINFNSKKNLIIEVAFISNIDSLRAKYFKQHDCFFEFYAVFSDNKQLVLSKRKFIFGIIGYRVFKLKGFMNNSIDSFVGEITMAEAIKLRDEYELIDEKKRDRLVKGYIIKRTKELKKEIASIFTT